MINNCWLQKWFEHRTAGTRERLTNRWPQKQFGYTIYLIVLFNTEGNLSVTHTEILPPFFSLALRYSSELSDMDSL